jgi:NADH-quinone oxidoreductase subunit N
MWSIVLSLQVNGKPIKYLTDLTNLSKTQPITALLIAFNLFSMAGIPPLVGFFSKMFILYSAIQQSLISLAIVGILMSTISAFYYIRIIKIMYFDNLNNISIVTTMSKSESIIVALSSQFILFFCLMPEYLLNLLTNINLIFVL